MAIALIILIYLSFISLGLPDGLLGAAWPSIYPSFSVPVSYAGYVTMIIAGGTIVSSLSSDRLSRRFSTQIILVVSVALTALAIFGFSFSTAYWQLCLWAIPYGFGAGAVDSSLNNYVSLHYKSRQMSWLHSFWGRRGHFGALYHLALPRPFPWLELGLSHRGDHPGRFGRDPFGFLAFMESQRESGLGSRGSGQIRASGLFPNLGP